MPYTYLGTPYTTPQGGVYCAWSGGDTIIFRGHHLRPAGSSILSSSNNERIKVRILPACLRPTRYVIGASFFINADVM